MKHTRRILTFGCIYTTLISLFIFVIAALIGNAEGTGAGSLTLGQYLLIALFSFLIAGADTVLISSPFSLPLRLLIHYAVLLAGFLVIFSVSGNLKLDSGASIFVATVLFTFAYALVMAIVLSLLSALGKLAKKGKKQDAAAPYRSIFR